ncbi:MAG: cytochrome c [Gammaproteobacteria bacterium]
MRRLALPLIATCLFAGLPAIATAATAPADAIKYRQAVMDGMAAHVNAVLLLVTGKVDHPDQVKGHADALAALAENAKTVFPADSGGADTRALPLIWEDRTQFDEIMVKLTKSTGQLRDAVAANDKAASMAAFKAVGESCKACHDRYRKPKD